MQVCNYTMKCNQFTFDFAQKDKNKLNTLYDDDGLYSFYVIPQSEKFNIKILYPKEQYHKDLVQIKRVILFQFIFATLLLFMISLIFTFYSLKPIRKALQLNDEFIKDILHDFNTPITSMVLNIQMFKKEKGEDRYIKKVSHSVDTILLLQNNLKSFLDHSPSQNIQIDIASLAKKRLDTIQNIYPKLTFVFTQYDDLIKITNEDIITRILDNLLSNAAKYNKPKGIIELIIQNDILYIKDTGKGIQDVNKIFQRHYKEQDRGLGLGLHIVQKLSDELNIKIKIKSVIGVGTECILDFSFLENGIK